MCNKTKEASEAADYKQQEEIVDGKLVVTINRDSLVDDLSESITGYMTTNGLDYKYKVTISKTEEEY